MTEPITLTPSDAPAVAAAPEATTPSLVTTPAPPLPSAPEAAKPLGATLYGESGQPREGEPSAAAAAPKEEGAVPEPSVPTKEGEAAVPAPLTADSYADLALPEGLEVNPDLFAKFKSTAAESGIAPDKAPALLELFKEAQVLQNEATVTALRKQNATWQTELEALPEFKGERKAVAAQVIGRAIEEFGTPAVRSTLDAYGLGNNPDLARFIHNMAVALVEGTITPSGNPAPNGKDGKSRGSTLGARLYPNTPQ